MYEVLQHLQACSLVMVSCFSPEFKLPARVSCAGVRGQFNKAVRCSAVGGVYEGGGGTGEKH